MIVEEAEGAFKNEALLSPEEKAALFGEDEPEEAESRQIHDRDCQRPQPHPGGCFEEADKSD